MQSTHKPKSKAQFCQFCLTGKYLKYSPSPNERMVLFAEAGEGVCGVVPALEGGG